jgi:hypothetical protein
MNYLLTATRMTAITKATRTHSIIVMIFAPLAPLR